MAGIEVLIFLLMSREMLVQGLNTGNNFVHKVHFGTRNSMDMHWLHCLAAWLRSTGFLGEFLHNSCARVDRLTKTWFTLNFLSTGPSGIVSMSLMYHVFIAIKE